MSTFRSSKARKPPKASRPQLSVAQQLTGFKREYKPESDKAKAIAKEAKAAGRMRRRIEDIAEGLRLDRIFKEEWDK